MTNALDTFLKKDLEKWGNRDYLFELKGESFVPTTYREFIEKVNFLAAYLSGRGLKGKCIGIYGPNSIRWMISDVAIIGYVGCSVGFPRGWSYDNLEYSVRKAQIECLIYDEEMSENVGRLKAEHPDIFYVSMQNDFDACLEEGRKSCGTLFSTEPSAEDTPAKVVFTSGTTSFPKAVMLSVNNIFSGWRTLERRVTLNEEDSCYLFLPLHHTYGSIYNFMYSLVFGYSVYLAGSLQNMIAEMKIVRPTAFSGVPKTYTKILEASEKYGVSIPSLFGGRMKYLFSGGAILSPELRTVYKDAGLNIMNAYGLSETSSGFCLDYPDEEDMESAGTLMEDIDAKVLDPAPDGYGELIVKGDLIFKGYMNDEAATKAAFTPDGYFLTGDIGTIRNNKVYVRCRKDKLITLPNGENVSPKRIEEKIRSIRTDITAAKIYIRDDKLNADIYVQDPAVYDDPEVRKSLIDELNGSISKFERIDKCNIISSLQMMK